ncbi:hypothetical protein WR25_21679 [Diploscapter pachys]|uniref:3-hydroxyisobutyryl-coenzyme A hydrolase n=1 Tax=Diploscapter pachys TaxID=2018661 RepID=A0A2A2LC63_9BILA|nr:hypothetical protein WR25_21679 [Diploscapter pachys]
MPHIETRKDGKLFWIIFNRPDKLNGLTQEMMVQITKAFYDADEDPESAITVLTGNGKLFTAGADFSAEAMMGGGMQDKYRNSKKQSKNFRPEKGNYANFKHWIDAMIVHSKPIVALVNGPAAYFYCPFSVIGLCAEGCSSYIFPRSFGYAAAAKLALFSEKVPAQEAHGFGMVTKVIPHDKFEQETTEILNRWKELSPLSMKTTKRLMRSEEEIGKLMHVNKIEHDNIIDLMQNEQTIERIMTRFNKKSKIMGNLPLVQNVAEFLEKSKTKEASRTDISFAEFLNCIREMNKRCFRNANDQGEYLCFAINKNDVDGVFWKQRLRIRCFKINSQTSCAVAQKDLSLDEFMNAYSMHKAMQSTNDDLMARSIEILGDGSVDGQCCICMDNTNEVSIFSK